MTGKTDEIALHVRHVSKDFRLPHEKNNSIKSSIVNILRSKDTSADIQHALKDVSFDIKKGEFFGILGRNGSGKSTMLKILAEIYQPTKGEVHTKGKLVPFIELGVGFNPELTGRENVYLNGALLGFSRKEIDARYDDIVTFAELEDFMDQKLKNYSSGMQVRLAFSVATRAEADILLVDEVLAVGDADFQRKCFTFFKALKKKKTTVIFVTHDMNAVREYCDRAILINEGVIAHEGDALEVAGEYLKLFNKITSSDDKSSSRWGNKQAEFTSIEATALEGGKGIKIVGNVLASHDIEDLVAGVRVKNSSGAIVTGFNSEDAGKLNLTKGQKGAVEFIVPDIFGNDIFAVDATLRLSDGVTICDNWDNAASFSVLKNTKAPYSVVPEVKVRLEREK